jgi:hypothetical protein
MQKKKKKKGQEKNAIQGFMQFMALLIVQMSPGIAWSILQCLASTDTKIFFLMLIILFLCSSYLHTFFVETLSLSP